MNRSHFLLSLALTLPACAPVPTGSTGMLDPDSVDPADVARCVERAEHFRDLCASANGATDERVRLWAGYAELCQTGNTELLLASLECLDETQCRTFTDPNEDAACLEVVHAGQPQPIRDVLVDVCDRCGLADCPAYRFEIYPYLPATEAAPLAACSAEATCSADGLLAACERDIAQLAPFVAD